MPVLAIPDPCVIVLIGAAGAGKSTFAARHFHPSEVLSSDGFRAMIAGDEADQGATRAAFGRLHRELDRRLGDGRLTVIDATNVERSARRALLMRSKAAGVVAVAIVLDLPPFTVLARSAARTGRVVAEPVVRRHLGLLRWALDGPGGVGLGPGACLEAEGFSQVIVLRSQLEIEAIAIVRLTG